VNQRRRNVFDFLNMIDNYDERKIARYEKGDLIISTAEVSDTNTGYETAICHPKYNDGEWIIVQEYNSKIKAKKGHKIWVNRMTMKKLPPFLKDVSTLSLCRIIDKVEKDMGIKDGRIKKKK